VLQRNDPLCRLVKRITKISFRPFYHIQVEGQKRLPRKDACILLPKHQRWQDIPIIATATPRPLYYIAKHELFINRLTGGFLESLGGIPLNREAPMKSRGSIRALIQFLKKGEGVVIFPEGTYYVNRMGPGKPGMLRLILSRMVFPLVPVGVRYGDGQPRTPVRVCFGNPIYPDRNVPPDALLGRVMKEIALLSRLETD